MNATIQHPRISDFKLVMQTPEDIVTHVLRALEENDLPYSNRGAEVLLDFSSPFAKVRPPISDLMCTNNLSHMFPANSGDIEPLRMLLHFWSGAQRQIYCSLSTISGPAV